ncbi:MAG: tetratricopeptide repeat protein [candidate division Zixibacteria bacterium]|nr:tetratricopeptide repeat protein [candidate division Zixibacteria bacterium]
MKRTTLILLIAGLLSIQLLAITHRQVEQIKEAEQLSAQGKCKQAFHILTKLDTLEPGNVQVRFALLNAYVCAKDFAAALEIINGLIDQETNPARHLALLIEKGRILLRQGEKEAAEMSFRAAMKLERKTPESYRKVANAFVSAGYYTDAARLYLEGREELNNPTLFAAELGHLYEVMRNYGEAVREYFLLLVADSTQVRYVGDRISALNARVVEERFDTGLETALTGLIKDFPQNKYAHKYYADFLVSAGRLEEAFQRYLLVDNLEQGDGVEILYFCKLAGEHGDYRLVKQARDYLIDNHPRSPGVSAAAFILGETYFANRLYGAAITVYEEIIAQSPAPRDIAEATFRIGHTRFKGLRDPQGALDVYRELTARYPTTASAGIAALIIADCHLALGEAQTADSLYQVIPFNSLPHKYQEQLLFRRGELQFYLGQYDAARRSYGDLMQAFPRSIYVNDCLRRMMLITEHPDMEEITLRLYSEALYAAFRFEYDSSLVIYGILKNRLGTMLREIAWYEAGETYELIGQPVKALAQFDSLIALFPEGFYAPLALEKKGDVYAELLDDQQAARQMYETVLLDYPQGLNVEEVRRKLLRTDAIIKHEQTIPKS